MSALAAYLPIAQRLPNGLPPLWVKVPCAPVMTANRLNTKMGQGLRLKHREEREKIDKDLADALAAKKLIRIIWIAYPRLVWA